MSDLCLCVNVYVCVCLCMCRHCALVLFSDAKLGEEVDTVSSVAKLTQMTYLTSNMLRSVVCLLRSIAQVLGAY